jgi:hypothetical protein
LLHAAANAVQYLMLEDYFTIPDKWKIVLAPGTGILSCAICMIAGILVRTQNRKQQCKERETES